MSINVYSVTRLRWRSYTRVSGFSTSAPAGDLDVLPSVKRVGSTGFAYGVDMTDKPTVLAIKPTH